MKQHIEKIKSFGFRVFQRKGGDNHAFFSDGKNIGYIENAGRGLKCSTVHIPNRTTGTGYGIEISEISKSELEKAFCIVPHWASPGDIPSVVKYSSLEAFLKSPYTSWGDGLHEV